MAARDFATDGTCLVDVHNERYNDFIDSLETRIASLEGAAGSGLFTIPADHYSTLGSVTGGTTVAAGSVLPATGGELTINSGAKTWVRISGTAAQAGDRVFHIFEGSRVSFADNPANRRVSAAGPGAAGEVLAAGVIELAISSTNPDGAKSSWFLLRKGA